MLLEKELKEVFSVKLQIKGLVLCKIKIKQNPGYPNKQYKSNLQTHSSGYQRPF